MLPKMAGWGGVKATFISDLKAILPLYRILESEAPHTAISCGLAIKETLPISIFLAVSTVNKVSYKLYRRGLFECSSPRSRRAHEFRSL